MSDEIIILVETLVKNNFKLAFGISGSGISYQLIDALTQNGIRYIPVSNEAAAAIAAGAATYINQNNSICISIKGPGFVNMLSGITACFFEKFSIISFSEDFDVNAPILRQHKRLNQVDMVKPVVNKISSFNQIHSFNDFIIIEAGNELPVHFELAKIDCNYEREKSIGSYILDDASFNRLLNKIQDSRSPVLIVGSLLYRIGKAETLNELKLPVFTTAQAKGSMEESLPNACGTYTGVGESLVPENEILTASDCIITIGLRNYEILSAENKRNFLNFDILTNESDNLTSFCSLEQIDKIIVILKSKKNWCAEIIVNYQNQLNEYIDSFPWMPGQIFQTINRIDEKITLVLDTGTFCTIGEHVYTAGKKKRFIGSSNGRNMGISVPMALGVAINSNPVICCFGDGGIRYHIGEIRTIAEMNLPVCFILISDRLYGSIACSINKDQLNDKIVQPLGMEWYKVIEAMNIPSGIAKNKLQFDTLLEAWNHEGPYFIEAVFDTEIYAKITKNIRK